VFNYPPKWTARWDGANDTTRLILDFKEAKPLAIATVVEFATRAFVANRKAFEQRGVSHVVVAPTSIAGERNEGCEQLAASLASRFGLAHLPGALVRTTPVPSSHLGGALSAEAHVASMAFSGPSLRRPVRTRLYCEVCRRADFRTTNGLTWHLEHIHGLVEPTTDPAVLLVDDVITNGRTAEACRQVLATATGGQVVGFFVGKTRGW
jgi:hypothetical protein